MEPFEIEGPKIEKMLGYTNIDSEKGFLFFQKFMKDKGILKELEARNRRMPILSYVMDLNLLL